MRHLIRLLALIALLLASTSRSRAETAEEMLSACRPFAKANVTGSKVELPQDFDTGYCWGAFAIIQRVIVHLDERKQPIYAVCASPRSTRTQLITIFVKYAENNPKRLHEEFFDVALASLWEAFPCNSKNP